LAEKVDGRQLVANRNDLSATGCSQVHFIAKYERFLTGRDSRGSQAAYLGEFSAAIYVD
jgi:hypothetical protein